MYQKLRLQHVDSRWRRDLQFLFHLGHRAITRAISSGVFATVHSGKMGDANVGQVLEKMAEGDAALESNLAMLTRNVRGSSQYWATRCSELRAMDEKFGPCTFFITLSAAEYAWPDLDEFQRLQNRDIKGFESARLSSLNVNDPVSVSIQFNRRLEVLKAQVLDNPKGPLGKVAHWWYRVEYQARGAPHIHMKVWIDGAPVYGVAAEADVADFIQKYITCGIPADTPGNARLRPLVMK